MDITTKKSILAAATTGLMLGALSACGGSAPEAESPEASAESPMEMPATTEEPQAIAVEGGKACCKGLNECKGKGSCKTAMNECSGRNECKGKGGCSGHCPK